MNELLINDLLLNELSKEQKLRYINNKKITFSNKIADLFKKMSKYTEFRKIIIDYETIKIVYCNINKSIHTLSIKTKNDCVDCVISFIKSEEKDGFTIQTQKNNGYVTYIKSLKIKESSDFDYQEYINMIEIIDVLL